MFIEDIKTGGKILLAVLVRICLKIDIIPRFILAEKKLVITSLNLKNLRQLTKYDLN